MHFTYTHNARWTGRLISVIVLTLTACAYFAIPSNSRAQAADKFYYWVTPFVPPAKNNGQSFVIEVESATKSKIDSIRSRGGVPQLAGQIAAGSASYNKNYFAAGHPVWNWYFTSVDQITDYTVDGPPGTFIPENDRAPYESNPSDIAADPNAWITQHGNYYAPARYAIGSQIDPSNADAVANVSNRGLASTGEKTLITGFILKGGEPRNVVVRALGPSLGAFGVQQFATNPKIEVFGASGRRFASNTDWKNDARASALSQSYPTLAPSNDKEAALLLTLTPGAYTLQGTNEDGTEGVMLLEAYDVDSPAQ